MTYQVIDNFLNKDEFEFIKFSIVDNQEFFWYINNDVVGKKLEDIEDFSLKNQGWNWYMTHMMYPCQSYFDQQVCNIFSTAFQEIDRFTTWIRIKSNLYPYTDVVHEHHKHYDYKYAHNAAVFSLNTCNGFTRMVNGDKIDSVENRIVIFDGSQAHNSSTTSDSKQRVNINFNWL